jgi:hypothetical protein
VIRPGALLQNTVEMLTQYERLRGHSGSPRKPKV